MVGDLFARRLAPIYMEIRVDERAIRLDAVHALPLDRRLSAPRVPRGEVSAGRVPRLKPASERRAEPFEMI